MPSCLPQLPLLFSLFCTKLPLPLCDYKVFSTPPSPLTVNKAQCTARCAKVLTLPLQTVFFFLLSYLSASCACPLFAAPLQRTFSFQSRPWSARLVSSLRRPALDLFTTLPFLKWKNLLHSVSNSWLLKTVPFFSGPQRSHPQFPTHPFLLSF